MTDTGSSRQNSTTVADCATCGAAVETDEWHPVTSEDDAGETRIVPFCSEACRERWLANHPQRSAGEP